MKKKSDIIVPVAISQERLLDYVERANYSYWGVTASWDPKTLTLVVVENDDLRETEDRSIQDWEWDPKDEKRATLDDFVRGLVLMSEKYFHHFADIVTDKGDMYTGDLLVQLAMYKKEKYA